MTGPYDALVVGSGFGGAVTACRLAEAGYRVLVLERGRRWGPDTFPRNPGDPWIFDPERPERRNGWLDVRFFRHMGVAQGAGVGGGSLVYANVSVEPQAAMFEAGWPPEVSYQELAADYQTVGRMLNVQAVPIAQWPARTRLMDDAASAIGEHDRFRPLDLAVNFDPAWRPDLPDAREVTRSLTSINAEGIAQGTCIHLGQCDIGCPVKARNTLDFNYLARAERHGAEIRPLHLVRSIEQDTDGYRINADRIVDGALEAVTERARLVIVAAGSLGSTELLLRCRDTARTLPRLPAALGQRWSSNGDFLTLGYHASRSVMPTVGPTITSAIDFRDGSRDGQSFLIEDGGFPDVIALWLEQSRRRWSLPGPRRLLARLLSGMDHGGGELVDHVMPWFAQGRDAADGHLRLGRKWWFLGPRVLKLDWDVRASLPLMTAIEQVHERLATATGGKTFAPPTWALLRYLITPHPLGGCNMGISATDSVVDHRGEVWNQRNLFVADGSIVPEAIGANPSRTIAALAERIARLIVEDGR
jgi:cholesterol oxidase